MAGSVLDYRMVILFVHQCKQIKYTESELNLQVLIQEPQCNGWYNNYNEKQNGIVCRLLVMVVINNEHSNGSN